MPLQETSGAASYDAFGGGVPVVPNYIEDVFSTWLYTGTGATQTITNGIDLSTKGGLTWIKGRSGATSHMLTDTVRGATKRLSTNLADANQFTDANGLTAFGSTGFTIGSNSNYNTNAATYVSWTFREQPKFFDIVTYTGTGSNRTIAHNLGSVPGMIIVKEYISVVGSTDWYVYHRSLGATKYLAMNLTSAEGTSSAFWNNTAPTSTVFSIGTDGDVNRNGSTFVAYIFAHDAGGFGLTGTDNVISCGSFSTDSGGKATVNLGYEPQWVMFKRTDSATYGDWYMIDNMRGFTNPSGSSWLWANTSGAEQTGINFAPEATGFNINFTGPANWIYVAIRRGPMKVPTTGTSVFGLSARTGTGANATVTGSAGVSDAVLVKNRGSAVASLFSSRLTGTGYLVTSTTAAEVAAGTTILQANPWDVMDGVKVGTTSTITNASANTFINYLFKRAPSFFDEVCDTGSGAARTINHNLGVAPELVIRKRRSAPAENWLVLPTVMGLSELRLNQTNAIAMDGSSWDNTLPTSSVFSVGSGSDVNGSGYTYVTYLFATCAGVSKVGSYTGTGTTKQIDCGFTGGARFVLIKKTSGTGSWYVWDSSRGIVSGNDPYLLLNSTAAEVTNTDYIDTYSAGFEISSTAPSEINENGGSFIFLAIA